jgi:hypothetical protein
MKHSVSPSRSQRFGTILLTAIALSMGLSTKSAAQFEGFLDKVTDINIFQSCWDAGDRSASEDCFGRGGYGLEVMWNLGRFPSRKGAPEEKRTTVVRRYGRSSGTADDTAAALLDSTVTYQVSTPSIAMDRAILLELALGYSQFSGFGSSDDRYQLEGSVRELPAVTLYASFPNRLGPITPYLGLRTGLIELRNAQIYVPINADTAATFSGTAQAFQLGVALGVATPQWIPRTQLTGEVSYNLRNFPSVQWATAGAKTPNFLPRSLDFSGLSFSIGAQVSIRDKL